jgi:hypothetical protein
MEAYRIKVIIGRRRGQLLRNSPHNFPKSIYRTPPRRPWRGGDCQWGQKKSELVLKKLFK